MKTNRSIMTKALLLFAFIATSVSVKAFEVTINGLVYDLTGVSAKVMYIAKDNTAETITIPATIEYEGLDYTVNRIGDKCFVNIGQYAFNGYCFLFENGQWVDIGDRASNYVENYCHIRHEAFIYEGDGSNTFATNNSYVKSVYLPNTIESIGKYAFCNTQIKNIQQEQPGGIKSIDEGAFNTPQLTELILPNTLESIGKWAFYYSKLKEIIIPSSVLSMDKTSFGNCSLLRQITYLGANPPLNWTSTTITYVPNKDIYSSPAESINDANVVEMLSFNDKEFTYSGKSPNTTWTNNIAGSIITFDMPLLSSDTGSFEEIIPVRFTKDEDSFIANIPYRYTIEPATIKAKVSNTSRYYGEQNPQFMIAYSGFVNGENENILSSIPIVSTTATTTSDIGTYPITISGGEAKNYTFEYEQGELTVNKAALSIQVMDAEKVYGTGNPAFAIGYSGLKNNEEAPAWVNKPKFTTNATKGSDVGTYEIGVTCEPKNYSIVENKSGILTITKTPLTIKANNATMQYCGETPNYTFNYSGFVNGDNESVLTNKPTITTDATAISNVGSYDITPTGATAKNYSMEYKSGVLEITKRDLIVSVNSGTKVYGDSNPEFTLAYTGFVNNENQSVLDTEPSATTTANINSGVGTYDINVGGGKAKNYTFTYLSGQLTISPKELKVSVGNYEKTYGEDNPDFNIIYEGFAGNDTEESLNPKPIVRTTATKTSDVGTYKLEVTGGYSPNYTLSYGAGTLTINKAEQSFEWEQDLSTLEVGSQIELLAQASSGLPVTYTMDENDCAEIYKAGKKNYLECKSAGTFNIKAVQEGNDNYYSTQRINKTVTIVGNTIEDPILTIKQADNGSISTKVKKGTSYTFTIHVEEGWKIHSVTLNNEDVTSQLNEQLTFTTPAINENAILTIVYEKEGESRIDEDGNSAIKIQGASFGVRITDPNMGDQIRIYTMDGVLLESAKVEKEITDITLDNNKVYIIKVGTKTVKLSL